MIYSLVSDSLGRISFDSDEPEIARLWLVFETEDRYAYELYSKDIIETAKRIGQGYEWTRGVQRIDVILLPYLARGTVAFRRKEMWSNLPYEFKERSIGEVLTELRFGSFRGDYETLEALLPSKPDIEPRPNGPNVLSEESANHEVEPRPNGPNVLPSDEMTTAKSREIPSKDDRLAREYVRWAEKLAADESMRLFGRRRGLCPGLAIEAFKSHVRENGLKLGINSRTDERIRQIFEADESLNARLSKVISRAKALTKS